MNTGTSAPDKKNGYGAPGVYLEEKFRQPHGDLFRTGVPVFVGLYKLPTEKSKPFRIVLDLWSQFTQHVGTLYQDCMLGYAVRGFFQNGGQRCHVVVVSDLQPNSVLGALEQAVAFHN